MQRHMLKSKIHRATVTACDLHYAGSVTIDAELMEQADLLPGELVHVLDMDNGARFETYVIEGERGAGDDVPERRRRPARAAGRPRDRRLLRRVLGGRARTSTPAVVHVDERNAIVRVDGDPSALPFAEVAR